MTKSDTDLMLPNGVVLKGGYVQSEIHFGPPGHVMSGLITFGMSSTGNLVLVIGNQNYTLGKNIPVELRNFLNERFPAPVPKQAPPSPPVEAETGIIGEMVEPTPQ